MSVMAAWIGLIGLGAAIYAVIGAESKAPGERAVIASVGIALMSVGIADL